MDNLKKGKDIDEASKEGFKWHAIYGDPSDESKRSGEDKPLPYELKNRVNSYIENIGMNNPENYKQELQTYSSFNAFIRNKVKDGEL